MEQIDRPKLNELLEDRQKNFNLYLFDVRTPQEYALGHPEGFLSAQGGQLVQASCEFIGVANSTVVLYDDDGLRAPLTASWLIQMGWEKVYVINEPLEKSLAPANFQETKPPMNRPVKFISPQDAIAQKGADDYMIIDLSPSQDYQNGHIPGAYWALRSYLPEKLKELSPSGPIILTARDPLEAILASGELVSFSGEVYVLAGGNSAWEAQGRPFEVGFERALNPRDDVWPRPYLDPNSSFEAKRQYFQWEHGLTAQLRREGTASYKYFSQG
jgi:rhodanese-related sulfurtransferase